MGRQIGYMRLSTNKEEQSFRRQEHQLESLGLDVIYKDRVSGAKRDRPQLNQMLEELQEGDVLYIVSIDRLSRSTKDLLDIVDIIRSKGAYLKSLQDSWLDTSEDNPLSEFLLTIMGGLAQMERKMIQKRVQDGIDVAKAKGVQLGRPKKSTKKVQFALEMYTEGKHTVKEIAEITGVSKATIYRKLREQAKQEQVV
jgi:DNA invertase Pin-like site-specific DNA recombinase